MTATAMPAEEFAYGLDVTGLDTASLGEALRAVVSDALSDPARMARWAAEVAAADGAIGMNMLKRFAMQPPDAVASPAAGDKRFADAAWESNPLLAGTLESYLVRTRAAMRLIEESTLPDATRRKARFAMTILSDALAPSNVPWMNPSVVKAAVDSGGGSLVRGMQNYLDDVQHNAGKPRQVDASAFTLGQDLAATPGRVVHRNELMELIAYEPQTTKVHANPLLCSPPWINKYYIMDLAPGRSFIEWAVQHGRQTFAISYRNPDASMADVGLEDYLRLGPLAAIDAIREITGGASVDIAALCLGGTLTAIAAAHLSAKNEGGRIGSITLTNTLIDFTEPGDLGVFTDEATIARLESGMRERGVLGAEKMGATFDWMRANDLIWSYVVNNWFMGKAPPAFDILRWNADTTNMPAAMHSQYLRTCYLKNALVEPGAVTLAGTPIDFGTIRAPLFVLGAEADHIAPWRSQFATTQRVGSDDVTYTLSNAGHIAGIVNPANNPKAWHRSARVHRGDTPDQWLARTEKQTGSWWTPWTAWAAERAGPLRAPYALPEGEAAPGTYARASAS